MKDADFLITDEGRHLISGISPGKGEPAQHILALRKRGISPEIASGVVEIAAARYRARFRFSDAESLFFTAESLAQATSPGIARYHAARLAPLGTIADLGCGIGMDAIALAEAGARCVIAIERDPVRLVFARANAAARGVAGQIEFRQADVMDLDWAADAVYWDPSRRERGGPRVSNHAERYEPPLSFLESVVRKAPRGGCVKLSPGLPDDVLAGLGGTIEFLSEGRECKEACLWFGEANRAGNQLGSAAVLLPENVVLAGCAAGDEEERVAATPIAEYVFDPDPAVIRARALGALAKSLALNLVSPADSYMTGNLPHSSHRAVFCYRVLYATAYKPRELASWLREHDIGRLVIKKRHFSKEPDAVARDLRLKGGGREAVLILVRREEGGHEAIICEPVKSDANL